jgi:hypothetical protein
MPILTLQRRLREAGRIRIGQQVPTSNGKTRPAKLDAFRLTSADQSVITEAARLYGGNPKKWDGAPVGDQWEVITTTTALPVIVPPSEMAFSQFFELWSGGGCQRRCDGNTELLSGESCVCDLEDEKACKPTTRLSVILQQLPGLGVWRLESHGWYAATELAGTVEVCQAAAARGQLLPAVLRLEQRQVKRIVSGKPQTMNFAVPILDIPLTPLALGINVSHEIGQGDQPALPAGDATTNWQPLTAPPEIAGPPIADAVKAPANPPRKTKASPPEIRPTGLAPGGPPTVDEPPVTPPDRTATLASDPQLRHIQTLYSNIGVADVDRKRCSAGIVGIDHLASHHDLTVAQASALIDRLNDVKNGRMDFMLDGEQHPVGVKVR